MRDEMISIMGPTTDRDGDETGALTTGRSGFGPLKAKPMQNSGNMVSITQLENKS